MPDDGSSEQPVAVAEKPVTQVTSQRVLEHKLTLSPVVEDKQGKINDARGVIEDANEAKRQRKDALRVEVTQEIGLKLPEVGKDLSQKLLRSTVDYLTATGQTEAMTTGSEQDKEKVQRIVETTVAKAMVGAHGRSKEEDALLAQEAVVFAAGGLAMEGKMSNEIVNKLVDQVKKNESETFSGWKVTFGFLALGRETPHGSTAERLDKFNNKLSMELNAAATNSGDPEVRKGLLAIRKLLVGEEGNFSGKTSIDKSREEDLFAGKVSGPSGDKVLS